MKDWHVRARKMRAQGWKLSDIAETFGVKAYTARYACRGIRCPVNHKRHRINQHGEFIREHYRKVSASHIAQRLGISRGAVIGAAYRMGLSRPPAPLPTEGE